jgi:hypothetical protein
MKIILKIGQCSDDSPRHIVVINGVEKYSVQSLSDCPEDAIIGRDLISGKQIISAIRMGYEAGKSGEELEISEVEDDE